MPWDRLGLLEQIGAASRPRHQALRIVRGPAGEPDLSHAVR